MLIWWITLLDFQILNRPYIPGRNPICTLYIIISIYFWIQLANILLRIFYDKVHEKYGSVFSSFYLVLISDTEIPGPWPREGQSHGVGRGSLGLPGAGVVQGVWGQKPHVSRKCWAEEREGPGQASTRKKPILLLPSPCHL